jgi:hypothetical protein
MHYTNRGISTQRTVFILLAALLIFSLVRPGSTHAQRPSAVVAQVGPGSPLPVYVTNELTPTLPDGFVPGSSWNFTTWTVPNTLSFTATVQRTEGGWALLTLATNPGPARWYYIPFMPGDWELQP